MRKGDLVLFKIQGKNVIGVIEYLIQDQVSIHVSHSFKIQRGTYLVQRSQVRVLNYCNDLKKWTAI
jgi:hypothetical protein